METTDSRKRWLAVGSSAKLVVLWSFAVAIGAVLATAILAPFVYAMAIIDFRLPWDAGESWPIMGLIFLIVLIPLAAGGLLFGACQWLVLRRRIKARRAWMWMNSFGWTLALLLLVTGASRQWDLLGMTWIAAVLARTVLGMTWIAALFGVLGVFQWLVLRRTIRGAVWWIVAWAFGGLCAAWTISCGSELPLSGGWSAVVTAMAILMPGLVTGIALSVILDNSPEKRFAALVLYGTIAVFLGAVAIPLSRPSSQQTKVLHVPASDIGFSGSGATLAAVGGASDGRGQLTTWSTADWHATTTLGGESLGHVAVSPDGGLVVTGANWFPGGDVTIRDAAGKVLKTIATRETRLNDLAISPDGTLLAIASGSYVDPRQVDLWDLGSGNRVAVLAGESSKDCVAFSPDGKMIATGSDEGTVMLWDTSTQEILHTFVTQGLVNTAVFSPDGKLLLAAVDLPLEDSVERGVQVWDLSSGEEITPVSIGRDVKDLAISPDGRLLAVASGDFPADPDPNIYLYELSSGQLVRVLKGHVRDVTHVEFSPDGRYLASSSYDQTVRIWDIGEGNP